MVASESTVGLRPLYEARSVHDGGWLGRKWRRAVCRRGFVTFVFVENGATIDVIFRECYTAAYGSMSLNGRAFNH